MSRSTNRVINESRCYATVAFLLRVIVAAMGDFLTSEQREFRRLEQERADAEYARHLAGADESAGESLGAGGDAAAAGYHQIIAGGEGHAQASRRRRLAELPPIKTFLCCISLRCGVLIIAGCDVAAAFCQGIASLVVLMLPELVLEADDETLLLGADAEARSRRFLVREMRVRFLLSVLTVFFGVRGFHAVQRVDARRLREYLNWKVLVETLFAVMGVVLHRLWWDGCGYLPADSCWDMRYTYLTNTLFGLAPPIYCIWAVWSLYQIFRAGDDDTLAYVGFVPRAEQADYPALGGNLWSARVHGQDTAPPKASPRTTYMV